MKGIFVILKTVVFMTICCLLSMLSISVNAAEYNMNVSPIIGVSAEGGGLGQITFLDEDKDSYTITPKEENGGLDFSAAMGEYYIELKTNFVKKAILYKTGKISIEGNSEDFNLGLTFNDGYGNLKWTTVLVDNYSNASTGSLEMAEEGMIYESDNMDAVAVKAYYLVDVIEEKTVNLDFSTKAKSVNFREVDDETLGVYIDADNDGIYETLIADSSRNESSPLPDKAVLDGSGESTVQSDQSAEPVESSDVMNGTVPVVIAGALAILLAGVIIFRRRNKTRY